MGRPKSEDKRKSIMKAAESLFASRRFHESTLDDVAKAAGVGKGTIYRYFRDKDDLFFQTAACEFDDLCDVLTSEVPAGFPFPERILQAIRKISEFIQDRRQVFGLGENEEQRLSWCKGVKSERWTGRRKRLVAALSAILEQGREEGLIRVDVPVDAMSSILLGMLRTRAIRRREGLGTLTLESLTDIFLSGASGRAPCKAARAARKRIAGAAGPNR